MARDNAHLHTEFSVVGGYLSPVNDRYAKPGLASAFHRVNMCEQAVQDTSEWIMVDAWEARQPQYLPTAQVLDHFDHELNTVRGGADVFVTDPDTGDTRVEKRKIRIMLLAGSDLILTMSEPGIWAEKDVRNHGQGMVALVDATDVPFHPCSCIIFWASMVATSLNDPSQNWTSLSFRPRVCTRAPR